MYAYLIVILYIFSNLNGEAMNIIATEKIADVFELFSGIDNNTLVIFDVDSTLLVSADKYLRRSAFKKFKIEYEQYTNKLTEEERSLILHLLVMESPSQLMESDFIKLLNYIERKRSCTLACTAARFHHIGTIFFPEFRFTELKSLGIDFSKSYSGQRKFTTDSLTKQNEAGIDRGIVYTGHFLKKGFFVEEIISLIGFMPNKIIIIDDKKNNLESFYFTLQAKYPAIEFLGIHYRKIETFHDKKLTRKVFSSKIKAIVQKLKTLTRKQL